MHVRTAPLRGLKPIATARSSCRGYHDESFGFRKPTPYVFPDYTQEQLSNRALNAPLLRYVDSMRTHGHRAARIDPLDLIHREEVAALNPERYGLTDAEGRYNVDGIVWTRRVGEGVGEEVWSLEEVVKHLRGVYVGRIGYEYMHSPSKTERLWFSHLLESQALPRADDTPLTVIDTERKKRIHGLLARSEVFDLFLQAKFPGLKRYGLEGGESMLPALDTLFSSASQAGVQNIVLAMPHRGRLNLLTDPHLLSYTPRALFHKIKGGSEIPNVEGGAEGDVLSHLVASKNLEYRGGEVKVELLPNPSHLEAAAPVALGNTRAKQYTLLRSSPSSCSLGDRVMCVQIHGDASFTGQGVVMESLGLSGLPHYTSGGSVHLVVDNNIGYTTPASGARSSAYCSDIGKMINAPVLHVNGDYPEGARRARNGHRIPVQKLLQKGYYCGFVGLSSLGVRAFPYYRLRLTEQSRHNELDIPGITSPLMYEKIAARRSVPELYEERLINEGVLTESEITSIRSSYREHLEAELSKTPSYHPPALEIGGKWKGIVWPASPEAVHSPDTGVDVESLKRIGKASVAVPEGFEIHPKLHRHVKSRLASLENGKGLDWATAEALAFGSLMLSGVDVRISGQDVGRGTFSHRHAMLVNQKTEGVIVPLNDELEADGKLELANSSLSEFGVLGFEYGASWEKPDLLPIWEAQFGDFFNGAQVIIDTFIASAETKWLKQSGIVLMLPHGLDGAGPEHSSSRIERMLQLTNDRYATTDGPVNINMHVVFPTTPAQYFHLLRRQILRNYRKPLIIAGPKGLLRLAAASSSLADLEPGTRFQPVIADPVANPSTVKRVVLVSGKIYYELFKARQDREMNDDLAFIRIEELAPFPFSELKEVLKKYKGSKECVWLQEEPRNQGAYMHVAPRIESVLKALGFRGGVGYRGRRESAVPAPGIGKLYKEQQAAVIESAFEGL